MNIFKYENAIDENCLIYCENITVICKKFALLFPLFMIVLVIIQIDDYIFNLKHSLKITIYKSIDNHLIKVETALRGNISQYLPNLHSLIDNSIWKRMCRKQIVTNAGAWVRVQRQSTWIWKYGDWVEVGRFLLTVIIFMVMYCNFYWLV